MMPPPIVKFGSDLDTPPSKSLKESLAERSRMRSKTSIIGQRDPGIPSNYLSREDAISFLGISSASLTSKCNRGLLRKHIHGKNVYFDIKELEVELERIREAGGVRVGRPIKVVSKPAVNPGGIASTVFRLLKRGIPLNECVIRTRITPEYAKDLHQQWLEMSGVVMTLTSKQVRRLSSLLDSNAQADTSDALVSALVSKVTLQSAEIEALKSNLPDKADVAEEIPPEELAALENDFGDDV